MVKIDKWGDVVVAPTEFGTDGAENIGIQLARAVHELHIRVGSPGRGEVVRESSSRWRSAYGRRGRRFRLRLGVGCGQLLRQFSHHVKENGVGDLSVRHMNRADGTAGGRHDYRRRRG